MYSDGAHHYWNGATAVGTRGHAASSGDSEHPANSGCPFLWYIDISYTVKNNLCLRGITYNNLKEEAESWWHDSVKLENDT